MTVTERVAYLKGLFEGLEIDTEKKEGKLLSGMLSALDELAEAVTTLKQQNEELLDELDDVYEELSAITEDFLLDDDDTEDEIAPDPDYGSLSGCLSDLRRDYLPGSGYVGRRFYRLQCLRRRIRI